MAIWEDIKRRYLDTRQQLLDDKEKVDVNENVNPDDYKFSESPIAQLFAKLKDTDISGGTGSKLEGAKKVFNDILQPIFDNTPVGRQIGLTPEEREDRVVERYGNSVDKLRMKNPYSGEITKSEHPVKELAGSSGFGSYLTENPLALAGMAGGASESPVFDDVALWDDFTEHAGQQLDYYKAPETNKMLKSIKYEDIQGTPMAEVEEMLISKIPKTEMSDKVVSTLKNWIKSNGMKWLNNKGLLN